MRAFLKPPGRFGQPDLVKVEFGHPSATAKGHSEVATALGASAAFRDYQRAFGAVTGLPLTLRPVVSWQLAHHGDSRQNAFCALMSGSNRSCAACLQLQQRVCDGTNDVSCTMRCALGLNETSVGVKTGQEIVAYLQTGQVFFKPPTPQQTMRAFKQLAAWGVKLNVRDAERCYHATPVIEPGAYRATVRLLEFFALQLGALANEIVLQEQTAEPEQITRARRFIEANFRKTIPLAVVANQAGMSMFYFCKRFKCVTGVHFTHYVKRVRVEQAKSLLLNQNYRVSEIAYEVGFQSLTHFNRAFKTIAGQSPSEYRNQLASRPSRHLDATVSTVHGMARPTSSCQGW